MLFIWVCFLVHSYWSISYHSGDSHSWCALGKLLFAHAWTHNSCGHGRQLGIPCMLEALARTLLSAKLGSCSSNAAARASFWRTGGLAGVHASHALCFVLTRFVQWLLGDHQALADFVGQEVVRLGRAGLCHNLLIDWCSISDEVGLRAGAVAQ